jgi:hypothetical protein
MVIPRWLIVHGDFPIWFKCLPSVLLGTGVSRFVWMGMSWIWTWAALEFVVWVVLACFFLRFLREKLMRYPGSDLKSASFFPEDEI